MTFTHRHLDLPEGISPEELPLDALDDVLDRGDLDDWRQLAAAIERDPNGPLAERVLSLCAAHEMYGTSRLWPAFIERARAASGGGLRLAELRRERGLSQAQVAAALGISQSDVSKLERRGDVRLSTLRRYVSALGGTLRVSADFGGEFTRLD